MTVRERLEQLEYQILAPYATKSADSRGRPVPEPPDPVRTAFQRDRDRIIHSKAFAASSTRRRCFWIPTKTTTARA
jgi:dGTPase